MVKLFQPKSGKNNKGARGFKGSQSSSKFSPNKSLMNVTTTDLTIQNQVKLDDHSNVFVKGALPGERINALILDSGKNSSTAVATKILKASEARIDAHCQYALGHPKITHTEHSCGGCVLGFTSDEVLLTLKQKALCEAMQRVFGERYNDKVWAKPITSPIQYRRKIRLAIDARNPKQSKVGFRQLNGKNVLPINQCEVCEPPLQKVLSGLSACVSDWHWLKSIGHISLLQTHAGGAVGFHATGSLGQAALNAMRVFGDTHQCMVLVNDKGAGHLPQWQSTQSYGQLSEGKWVTPELCLATIDDDLYPITMEDFIQVNRTVNDQMVQATIAALALDKNDRVLDLFSGAGNFTLPLARRCSRVLAVEGVAKVVERAAQYAKKQKFDNIKWLAGDLASSDVLGKIEDFNANKMVLDPARAGAGFILEQCDVSAIKTIVYVSCNPQSWLSDTKILHSKGFQLNRVQLLDMFRATHHTELLSVWTQDE